MKQLSLIVLLAFVNLLYAQNTDEEHNDFFEEFMELEFEFQELEETFQEAPAAKAMCPAPDNLLAVPSSNSVILQWSAGGSTISFAVQGRKVGAAPNSYGSGSSVLPYLVVSGLQSNQTYEWRVRNSCWDIGPSAWSSVATFTTTGSLRLDGKLVSAPEGTTQVVVFDLAGKEVQQSNVPQFYLELPAGIYIVHAQTANGPITSKVSIQ